jgi:hypothetical protein
MQLIEEFTRTEIDVADGTNSRSSPSRFASSSELTVVTPVRFPPGRLRLATRPSCTGSAVLSKTIGIDVIADFCCQWGGRAARSHNERSLAANQIGSKCGQPLDLIFGLAVFDHNIATFARKLEGILSLVIPRSGRRQSASSPNRRYWHKCAVRRLSGS